jgi:putative SOS response-associated peptidase YedK
MTALLRCRGALSEVQALFGAEPCGKPTWKPLIWPGEPAVAITERDRRRTVDTSPWGLPAAAFVDPNRSRGRRAVLFPRELRVDAGALVHPAELERCLIVLESFAYPDGPARLRTRAWAGLWEQPLVGWAGFCAPGGQGCAGLLVLANPLIERVSRHMPLLLRPDEHDAWLDGSATILSVAAITEEADFYLERTDERWSTGASIDDAD